MSEIPERIDSPKTINADNILDSKNNLTRQELQYVSQKTLERFSSEQMNISDINFKNYHGFGKWRIPNNTLESILEGSGIDTEKVQVEYIEVDSDLKNEYHYHSNSHAYCVILGEDDGFPDPSEDTEKSLGDNDSRNGEEVMVGEIIDIPPNTRHGFTANQGGSLYFLSVQSPPIVGEDGHDDYNTN